MSDDFKEDFVSRLSDAIEASNRFTKPYRQQRYENITRFVGANSGRSKSNRQPINVDHLAVSVLLPIIAGGAPQCVVTAKSPRLIPCGKTFELATNHVLREMALLDTYTMCALDGLFLAAFTKCTLTAPEMNEVAGVLHDAGMAFIDRIDFDDMILDSNAREWEAQRLIGHRFRMPLAKAKEIYQNVDRLGISFSAFGSQEARAEEIGAGKREALHELEDYVELAEVYLPREGVVLTIPIEQSMGLKPLATVEYKGPERGPYNMLSFMPVSDNLLPLAPSNVWRESSLLINSIARKVQRQTERSKNIGLYPKMQENDAVAIRDSNDGDMIGVGTTDTIKGLNLGGADPTATATLDYFIRLNSKAAGNIDLIGGLQATGSTATEANNQNENATVRVDWYKRRMREFIKRDVEKVAFYTWNDPLVQIEVEKVVAVPDGELRVPEVFSADAREGDFQDYNFEIDAASVHPKSPAEKAAAFLGFIGQVALPLQPMAQAQGMTLNVQKVSEKAAELMGVDNVDDLFVYLTPEQQAMAAANAPVIGGAPGMQRQAGAKIQVNGGGRGVGGTKPPMPAKQPMPMAREPQEAMA